MTEESSGRSASAYSWAFVVPMGNLQLTEAVGGEFRVDRVTFVLKEKLPRVRKRLGFGAPVSKIKKTPLGRDVFESAEAFAVVRSSGSWKEVERRCMNVVREEAAILSASQLGHSRRKQMNPVVPAGEVTNGGVEYLGVSSGDEMKLGHRVGRTAPFEEVLLDWRWKQFQDAAFFFKLLSILRGEVQVEVGWRAELRRASVLIGESVGANDLLKSFTWNMVVLEMLLTKQEGGLRDMLPKRAEALLGWIGFWESRGYEDRIRQVYGKRNALLHSGKRERITERDLAFTDHLILNLLVNLVGNPRLFGSKDDVVRFSERVEAERVLGAKPKVRPKDLRFFSRPQPEF